MPGVGHLVVILQEVDERGRRQAEGGRAAAGLLPEVALSLVEKAVFRGRDELLRRAVVVGVIRLAMAGERDQRGVMPVVVPEGVEAVAALVERADETRLLRLVLRHEINRPPASRRASRAADDGQDVLGGG